MEVVSEEILSGKNRGQESIEQDTKNVACTNSAQRQTDKYEDVLPAKGAHVVWLESDSLDEKTMQFDIDGTQGNLDAIRKNNRHNPFR